MASTQNRTRSDIFTVCLSDARENLFCRTGVLQHAVFHVRSIGTRYGNFFVRFLNFAVTSTISQRLALPRGCIFFKIFSGTETTCVTIYRMWRVQIIRSSAYSSGKQRPRPYTNRMPFLFNTEMRLKKLACVNIGARLSATVLL